MKNWLKFLFSRIFWMNFVLYSFFIFILFYGINRWLAAYTSHGNTITVPDLRGLTVNEINKFLNNKSLRYFITDSTIFDLQKPPGTVIEQDPLPGEKVKENRTIYLSIVRTTAPKIKMPGLTDISFRQAEAILNSYGLKTGKISFKPDLCKNCVLSFESGGRTLQAGDEISKGSVIDLVLGDGFGNTVIRVPDLIGLTLEEAIFVLRGSSLNAGAVIAEQPLSDSLHAVVYRQNPEPGDSSMISQGQAVDLFIRKATAQGLNK